MKTKLSLITLFTCALAGTSLFADNENYDEKKFSYGEDFSRRELANSSWIGATLEGAMFSGSTLSNADFTGANLEYAWFDNDSDVVDGVAHSYKITLTNTKFVSANLSHAYFGGADLTGCSFENANVTGANFSQSNLTVEQLQSTKTYKNDKNLSWMDLSHLDMLNADFSGITFFYTDFYDTALTGANFENAIIGEGTSFSHTRITTEQLCKTKTYKEEKSFSGVEFGWSDLSEIDFSKFILENTSFWGTTLEGVNFSEANLSNVSFTRYLAYSPAGMIYRSVDATNANFTCANLTGTRFYGVNLTKSDFRGSTGSDLGEITTSSSMSTNWGTNVILPDGTIKNFTLISGESWIIRSSGASKISAKLTGENTVTGGTLIISSGVLGISTLEIGESDTLILDDGKIITEGENAITIEGTLFVEKNSELCISATSNSGSSIFLTETGNIVFSETAKIVIDFDGYFEGEQEFSVITNRSNRSVDIDNISLNVNGSSYNTGLWKYAWNNGVLVVTLQTSDLTEDFLCITDPRQEIIISEDGFRGVFSGDLSEFLGSVSGKGSLNSSGTLVFSGDASAHSGTTNITSGTFTVAESAKIGTGSFDVEGTMAISGIRAFSNPTSGNGTLSIVSGTTTFTTDIGVKTLSVEQGASATLNAGVDLTHANAEAEVSGRLTLNGDRDFSATLSGAGTLATNGNVSFTSDASAFTGTTNVASGTFAVAESAALGTGNFDVSGTLALNGDRSFANATSGDGKIEVSSGATTFTTDVGTKTLSVAQGASATLNNGVDLTHANAEAQIAGVLTLNGDRDFGTKLSGAGTLSTNGNVNFTSDASAFTGTTHVASGTFAVSESAVLGTGDFDVSGMLALNGNRTFANATSGDGKIEVSSGATTFTTDVGTKTLSVAQGASATLNNGVDLTHSDAEAQISGVLTLNGDRDFGTKLSGSGILASNGNMNFGSDTSAFSGEISIESGTFVVEQGTILEISGALSVSSGATLKLFGGDTASVSVSAGKDASIVFANGANLVVDVTTQDRVGFITTVMGWTADTSVSGLDLLEKNVDISFVVNGVTLSSDAWNYTVSDHGLSVYTLGGTVIISETYQVEVLDRGINAMFDPNLAEYRGKISANGEVHSTGSLTFAADSSAHTGTMYVDSGVFTIVDAAQLGRGDYIVAGAGTLRIEGTRDFDKIISGAGTFATSGTITVSGDVSAHMGTTKVEDGSLKIVQGAKLGTGVFDVAGTLILVGDRTFENTTLGTGTVDVASGNLTFTKNVGTATLDISSGASATFAGTSNGFAGILTGAGLFTTMQNFVLSGDASGFSGKTSVSAGTFAVSESAVLGTGDFDVSGTLALNGDRSFANATSGDGEVEVASGSTTFTTDVGTKSLSVAQGASATLSAGVDLTHSDAEAQIAGVFNLNGDRDFGAKLSGSGMLATNGNVSFTSDASAFTGTTNVASGTLAVSDIAVLGTGNFDVSGTLALNGDRTFVNTTSGDGAISLVSGSNVLFTKPVGVKTLSVGEGATLRGGVEMTHGADAELSLAGTLVLNADKGEKVSLGGGKLALADSAKLDVVGNTSSARASATPIAALESGQEIVLIENGMVSGDVLAFLRTDVDLLAYSQNCAVVYDATNGLKVKVITDLTTQTGDVDLSELSTSFVDWVLSGTNKILLEENKGFVSAADFGSGLSGGNDPLLKAILSGDEGTARTILDRLSPKSYAVMAAMSVEAFNSDVRSISARLGQRRIESFDEKAPWEFFAQAQINSLENDMATDAPTFDFDTMGVLAGADYRVDAETTLGVAVGAGTGEAKIHNGGGKIESTDFRLTGFAGKTSEKCFVNAGVQLGCTSYDIKRNTDYGNVSGDTTGWSAGLFSDVGTVVTLSEPKKIYATPYIGLAYMHTQADAFTESGSDKAFDADSISGDSLRVRFGCGFTWNFALASANWHAGLDVAFSHDFLGDEVDIDVTTKSGEKISETAKALPEDMFSIGPMLSVDVSPSASIYGGYTFNAGTDSSVNHSANLGFHMRF